MDDSDHSFQDGGCRNGSEHDAVSQLMLAPLPIDDGEEAAVKLWQETGVRTLPGAYLSRDVDGDNPGKGYIRVAMVAPTQEMQRGLTLIRDCLYG